ncbi:cysteine hydrolase [Burkholderia thailandensis]|nr:isochorismatase family cysteine hydrolase [Burkholderia thailandensis]MCZ2899554.1 cysteine hydrolase [Burkholderia thailandensis]MDD1479772.1 cysteine hydrolase [Burkholderia thailandensis]MDD1486928.1 cysteine hydrolase [Burkholderia thailandensis]MDD1492471.1 cysteine hydrolase [Burkholderia thailandensis]PNE73550.1 cysteine hydrolase [Burkholderia thailandensis]
MRRIQPSRGARRARGAGAPLKEPFMPYAFGIEPSKRALLMMDYQNAILETYLDDDTRVAVIGRAAKLIAAARRAGVPVIHVAVAFRSGHPEISARNRLFSALKRTGWLERGAPGTAIHAALAPADGEPVVIKHRVSAFSGSDLDMLLRSNGIESLMLAGITTSGVVLSTVRHAFDLDYDLTVVKDCCADADHGLHDTLFDKVIAQHAAVACAEQAAHALSPGT